MIEIIEAEVIVVLDEQEAYRLVEALVRQKQIFVCVWAISVKPPEEIKPTQQGAAA